MTLDFDALPRLDIELPDGISRDEAEKLSLAQILNYGLNRANESYFQVWYPEYVDNESVDHKGSTSEDYDVLRVVNGTIENAPPKEVRALEEAE